MLLVPWTTLLWGTSAPAHQQEDTLGYEPGFATVRLGRRKTWGSLWFSNCGLALVSDYGIHQGHNNQCFNKLD